MALEDMERVRQFVNPELIALSLDGAVLDEYELTGATEGIQRSRAQFVVNAIAGELLTCRNNLANERMVYENKIGQLDEQIESIDELFAPGGYIEAAPLCQEQSSTFAKLTSWDDLEQATQTIEPFHLTVRDSEGASLMVWAEKHRDEIAKRYGRNNLGTFSRAAGAFTRYALRPAAYFVTRHAAGDVIQTNEPETLRKIFWDVESIGPKTAWAAVCISDIQREERGIDTDPK